MVAEIRSVRPFRSNPAIAVPVGTTNPLPDADSTTIDLELGCGTGMFAMNYASEHPNRHLIAIEQTVNKFQRFSRAYQHQPLSNLTPVHADAGLWVDRYLSKASVDRLFILYPNPYPKPKQRNLRWHYMPAMHSILNALKPGSELLFCTNLEWLVEEAAVQFSEGWGLKLESVQPVSPGSRAPLTRFEKKYLERGETCFDLRLRVDTENRERLD